MCLSVFLSICVSFYMSFLLYLCTSVDLCMSFCMYDFVYVCLSVCMSFCMCFCVYVFPYVCLFVCVCVFLYVFLCVCLSARISSCSHVSQYKNVIKILLCACFRSHKNQYYYFFWNTNIKVKSFFNNFGQKHGWSKMVDAQGQITL